MKYLKYLALTGIVVAAAFFGAAPAQSSEPTVGGTSISVNGSLNIGSGLSSAASITLGGQGPCATAGVGGSPAPENGGLCNVATSGTASGLCVAWSGSVSGNVNTTIATGSGGLTYSVSLHVSNTGGALILSGTATDPAGAVKQVIGSGAIAAPFGDFCSTWNGLQSYNLVATLTLL